MYGRQCRPIDCTFGNGESGDNWSTVVNRNDLVWVDFLESSLISLTLTASLIIASMVVISIAEVPVALLLIALAGIVLAVLKAGLGSVLVEGIAGRMLSSWTFVTVAGNVASASTTEADSSLTQDVQRSLEIGRWLSDLRACVRGSGGVQGGSRRIFQRVPAVHCVDSWARWFRVTVA